MPRAYMDASSLERQLESLREQNTRLARTIAELRNQDALKTQFLANISHDLRTPLTAVVTHAEMLRDGILGPLGEKQAESVAGIITGSRKLLEMVDEILTYARGDANQLTLSGSEFTVESVIDQVCRWSEPLVAKKKHALTVDIEPGLPPLHADRDKVAHILGNLLGNAIDFTPPGGRVWIAARQGQHTARGASVEIEVGDTGIGIAPEHHELVFREFAQVDASPSRSHHGTGLGLAIARKFVELHDGSILDRQQVRRGEPLPLHASRPRPILSVKPHVLVVEDSALVIGALRVLLEETGHRVSAATTVVDAVAAARSDVPDVILLDITLDREDGLGVLYALARTDELPRVAVAVTGHDDAAVRERCLNAGCRAVLIKPISATQLPAMIKVWLSESASDR